MCRFKIKTLNVSTPLKCGLKSFVNICTPTQRENCCASEKWWYKSNNSRPLETKIGKRWRPYCQGFEHHACMGTRARVEHLMWLVPCQHCIRHDSVPLMFNPVHFPSLQWVPPTHCCKQKRQHQSHHDKTHTSSISNLAVLTLPQVFLSRDTGLMFIPAERHIETDAGQHTATSRFLSEVQFLYSK